MVVEELSVDILNPTALASSVFMTTVPLFLTGGLIEYYYSYSWVIFLYHFVALPFFVKYLSAINATKKMNSNFSE